MPSAPTIELTGQLKYLVASCERSCVAGCCGINAFDFTPLHIASHISTHSRAISRDDIQKYETEIDELERRVATLAPDEDGYVCHIPEMNQHFRTGEFAAFIEELRHNLRVSPQILALSDSIELRRPGAVTMTPQNQPT